MGKNDSLIVFGKNLLTQMNRNFNLVDKILFESDLNNWWESLDNVWKNIFKKALGLKTNPTRNQLTELLKLEKIYCAKSDINNLEPLRKFKYLQQVELMDCDHLHSIEPLINNKGIKKLNLFYTRVENIETIKNFIQLEELFLSDYVTTLEPISELTNLKRLFFRHCFTIKSLEPLTRLFNLEELVISDNIIDLSPIDNLNRIKRLVCFGVSEKEANRYRDNHPNTEIIFGEHEKMKIDKMVEWTKKEAERIRNEGLSDAQKKYFGLK
jgi:hypothetical protein